jgi:SpoVK/Ycf46/Vps4 family AAA+-type ATPase
MNERYYELKKKEAEIDAAASKARSSNDYYTLVQKLREQSQNFLDLAECCPPNEKGIYASRSKEFSEKAKRWQDLHPEAFANVNQASNGGVSSDEVRNFIVDSTSTSFDDVVGCEDIKSFVRTNYIKRFSPKYKLVFSDGRGGTLEKGMLLFGLPGTGKTLIARAISTEVDATFMYVKASDLKDRFVGETEKKIRGVYEEAAKLSKEKNKPTIIFIDEIETLIPSRSGEIQNHESSAVTEFLTVLDGFEKEKMANVITIAASNFPDKIDAAAIRPGRLGAWFRVDVPDAKLRESLIKKQFSSGYSFEAGAIDAIVKKTKGFSGADVVALCGRIKSSLADKGILAIDNGLSDSAVISASSTVTLNVAEKVMKVNNSSISQKSIIELAAFEKNYNFNSENGSILEFMSHLK